ncbi:MAG: cardiolipin synthase B [Actinobacteria bacterium]|nr:cardiolipin synthase B [Actinomycetota bacterium]
MSPPTTSETPLAHLDSTPDPSAGDSLRRALEAVGVVFQEGNEVEVLRNGDEIFPAMLEALESAEKSIEFVTFIYWEGDIARTFAKTLARRSKAGVRVRVILDAWGSRPMNPQLVETMTQAGVQVERFRPVLRRKFWESDHRTHRKILVVDARTAFTGGVGIAEEWEGDARDPGEWRDTHFKLTGPAALALRATFFTDWRDCGHVIESFDLEAPTPERSGRREVAVIDASAQIGFNGAERAIEALVTAARSRILIATPYFNPPEELRTLLKSAIDRGVEVDVLVPGPHIDKRICDIVAETHFVKLVEHGVRIWRYQPTMMHVKATLVDGTMSLVGSVNVNRRSVEKDEEVAVAVNDAETTSILEDHYREDVAASELSAPTAARIPVLRKLVATLLRPIRAEM